LKKIGAVEGVDYFVTEEEVRDFVTTNGESEEGEQQQQPEQPPPAPTTTKTTSTATTTTKAKTTTTNNNKKNNGRQGRMVKVAQEHTKSTQKLLKKFAPDTPLEVNAGGDESSEDEVDNDEMLGE